MDVPWAMRWIPNVNRVDGGAALHLTPDVMKHLPRSDFNVITVHQIMPVIPGLIDQLLQVLFDERCAHVGPFSIGHLATTAGCELEILGIHRRGVRAMAHRCEGLYTVR
jgi:hypothetical protein